MMVREWTVTEALKSGAESLAGISAHARRDGELLLREALGCDLAAILAHPERVLSQSESARFQALLDRRKNSEPIQYILGRTEFFGLPLEVSPAALIPRPETETLVEQVLAGSDRRARLRIADVGTGSGAVAVALARNLPLARVVATDLSDAALDLARRNAERNGVADRIEFVNADLLAGLDAGSFDVVASNPPYIAIGEKLEPQVECYEPHLALFAGATGLEVIERLISESLRVLRPGGRLAFEIGAGQEAVVAGLLGPGGWSQIEFAADLRAIPRVAMASRAVDNEEKG